MKSYCQRSNLFCSLVSMLMFFLLTSVSLSAQLIIHHTLEDSIRSLAVNGDNVYYPLDINDDDNTNINFNVNIDFCSELLTKYEATARFQGETDLTELYVDGNLITQMEEGEIFQTSNENYGYTGVFSLQNDCSQFGGGSWSNGDTNYLGFRLQEGDNYYYGWVHVTYKSSYNEYVELVIHSFAYCTIPNQVISAGQTELSIPTDAITNLQIADIADNGDGRDLEVSFNKISIESSLLEYRVMVVKSSDSYAFNLEKADTVTNYLSVSPTGNNIITILNQNSKDVNGDIVRTNLSYRIYVLSVANGTQANINALSERSEMITLIGGSFVDDYNSHILNCYPNPTSSFVNYNSEHVFDLVEVYDVTGSLLSVQSVNDTHGTIDMSAYNEGSYYLIFKSDSQSVVKSLLKIDK